MTSDFPVEETLETRDWSDRVLLLQTYYRVMEMNGSVRRHDTELYGDPTHQVVGLRERVAANEAYVLTQRTVIKTIAALAGLIGAGNIAVLFKVFGG